MYLVATDIVSDKDVEQRIDDFVTHNSGKGYLTEKDVFVATGGTRLFLNSLPELANIIEYFAFNYAKGLVESTDESLGASIYTDDKIDEQINEDICSMTGGKQREMWMSIRKRVLDLRRKEGVNEDKPNLKHVSASCARVVGYSFSEADQLIERMEKAGVFARDNFFVCSNLELTMCALIGDFIYGYCAHADHEHAMELLRESLAI